MKQFIFRLQKLLNWRRQRKEAQSKLLADVLASLNKDEEALDCLAGQHRITQEGMRRQRSGVLDVGQAIRTEAYEQWLRERVDRQKERVAVAASRVDQERGKLNELAREEEVLERLRERTAQQHQKDNLRAESREIDEIASNRHRPASRQAGSKADVHVRTKPKTIEQE